MKHLFLLMISITITLFIFTPSMEAKSGKLYEVPASSVEIKDHPTEDAAVLTKLKKGDRITIFKEEYGWGKTFYHGKEAWVALYRLAAIDGDHKASKQSDKKIQNDKKAKDKQKNTNKSTNKNKRRGQTKPEKENKNQTHRPSDLVSQAAGIFSDAIKQRTKAKPEQAKISGQHKERNQQAKLDGYHIVIDPGHGGKDSGAIAADVHEKTLTLAIAERVAKQLQHKGADVTLTRKKDTYISLDERVHISNTEEADAFISLHMNKFEEPNVNGVSTFYQSGNDNEQLAQALQAALVDRINANDRGVKQENYQVLRDNKQLAVLIELGFISNPGERKQAQSSSYQKKTATSITTGLENYFNKS